MKTIFAIMILIALTSSAFGGWFADEVVDYNPGPGQWVSNPLYNQPHRALDRPYGVSASVADNTSVVTLGDGGWITLAFSEPVTDHPDNPHGYDFIVFSNCLWAGGDYEYRWQELAFVEISQDNEEWFLILPSILPSQLVGGVDTGQSFTVVRNYAEYTPTLGLSPTRTAEEFYTVPDRQSVEGNETLLLIDEVSGGGDAFDIAEAVKQVSPGVPLLDGTGNPVPAEISWFRYIRITDALIGDTQGVLGEVSAEIDAVARVRPAESVGGARKKSDDEYSVIKDAVVTAVFPGEVFIQAKDRSAAIKLLNAVSMTVGDEIILTGHLSTVSGERLIADPMITALGSGTDVRPLGMNNASISAAVSNLVRTWGEVKETGDGWFTIFDGSGVVKVSTDFLVPETGVFIAATGVVCSVDGEIMLRIRTEEDVQIVST